MNVTVQGMKRQAIDREKAFVNHIPDTRLVSKTYKEILNKNKHPIKNEQSHQNP